MDNILAAAKIIASARRKHTKLASLPPDIAPPDPGARLRVARVDGTILIVRAPPPGR